jgi:uncharacterized protein (TIGR02996 family)
MTQYADLLRAVIASPEDDAPRLILADYLDEQGECDRAEFIRVQCALARDDFDDSECRILKGLDRSCGCPCCALRRRERELLAAPQKGSPNRRVQFDTHANAWAWLAPCRPLVPDGARYCDHVEFRRGFVHTVRCRMEDWIGAECRACRGTGAQLKRCAGIEIISWHSCPHCDGTGRVNAHGPAVVAAQPVERVEATGREPYRDLAGTRWHWFRDFGVVDVRPGPPPAGFLPSSVFAMLAGVVDASRDEPHYPTRDAALDALSAALLAHAKSAGAMTDCQGGR